MHDVDAGTLCIHSRRGHCHACMDTQQGPDKYGTPLFEPASTDNSGPSLGDKFLLIMVDVYRNAVLAPV